MPNLPDDDDDDGPSNESDGPSNISNVEDGLSTESNNDDDDGVVVIPLVVTVTKKSGLSLEFSCMAFRHDVAIDALYVNLPGHSLEDPKVIQGMDDYKALDENVKKTFNKYLEVRVFDGKSFSTIFGYMMMYKIKREYWLLLDYVKEFLEENKIDS